MRVAEKNIRQGSLLLPLLLILFLEIMAVAFWFYYTKPESDHISGLFIPMAILLGINLLLGGVLQFVKNRYATLFYGNAVLCPLVFFAGWILWFTYWA